MMISNSKAFLGFYNDDLYGVQNLSTSTWYHIAHVYECATRTQSLYVNGYLDNDHQTDDSYQGTTGSLYFGLMTHTNYFNGLIDEFSYVDRAKTPEEILLDATLTFYFSFDNDSIKDQGSLQFVANPVGAMSFAAGVINQGLIINATNQSYFIVNGLVLLSISGQSFSMSIWIKPQRTNNTVITYLSTEENGSCGWCLTCLGIISNGSLMFFSWGGSLTSLVGPTIPKDRWTHIFASYSKTNGGSLYINGTFYANEPSFFYGGIPSKMHLFVGVSLCNGYGATHQYVNGLYEGFVDEFRLYSRELTSHEIRDLAKG